MRPWPRRCLYLVTNRPACRGRGLMDVIARAVAGGAGVVQLREKSCSTREFVDLAMEVKRLLAPLGVPLIINDRIDVALAADAEGVHVGQDDMPPAVARALLGPGKLLGVSVNTLEQALEAQAQEVDYLGVGPIFATATKADAKSPIGPEGMARIRAAVSLPLVGIGGIGPANAASVMAAGADGVAVVSAVCSAEEPDAAAKAILRAVRGDARMVI